VKVEEEIVTPRVGLVGDFNPSVRAHVAIPKALELAADVTGYKSNVTWVETSALGVNVEEQLREFDALWCVPASPYANMEGALSAIRFARESGRPFLGTCGGFQHAVLMLARDLAGIPEAAHAEYGPDGELVVVALECSLVGHEGALRFEPGSLIQEVMGVERSVERYHCAYGVARPYVERLEAAGVRFSARDEQGEVRALELGGHPFFLATLFQPELAGDGTRAHPVIRAFATACAQHARDRAGAVAA
jgi:CTP synthase (UTP-ammonia lyase)